MPIRASTWNSFFLPPNPCGYLGVPYVLGEALTPPPSSSNFAHQGCNSGLLPERFSPFRTIGVTFFFAVGKSRKTKHFDYPVQIYLVIPQPRLLKAHQKTIQLLCKTCSTTRWEQMGPNGGSRGQCSCSLLLQYMFFWMNSNAHGPFMSIPSSPA